MQKLRKKFRDHLQNSARSLLTEFYRHKNLLITYRPELYLVFQSWVSQTWVAECNFGVAKQIGLTNLI